MKECEIEVVLSRVSTPIGPVQVLFSQGALLKIVLPCMGRIQGAGRKQPASSQLKRAFDAWFRGEEGPLLAFPRCLEGSLFQRRVWAVTLHIPRGEVRTYKEVAIAAKVGPQGARAVGGALRVNPLPLVVPCHRVVGAGGRLVGFGGSGPEGLKIKEKLLALEDV